MKVFSVYITTKDREEAEKIGRALVEERLAACVNILEGMTSLYWWEGEVQQDQEAVLLAKTKEICVTPLIEKVKALHSYDCPCIVVYPIEYGNPAYLEWIQRETR